MRTPVLWRNRRSKSGWRETTATAAKLPTDGIEALGAELGREGALAPGASGPAFARAASASEATSRAGASPARRGPVVAHARDPLDQLGRGLRPARPAARRPSDPSASHACAQRIAVVRLTRNRRATPACVLPCSNSRAARIRRRSSASKSRRAIPLPQGRRIRCGHPQLPAARPPWAAGRRPRCGLPLPFPGTVTFGNMPSELFRKRAM